MKKHYHKIARHGHHRRTDTRIYGLGLGHYASPAHSPYYAYPLTVIALPETSAANVQYRAHWIWAYHPFQDKFSQFAPATEFKLAAGSYWILKA
jgi:hypothetical protein